MVLDVPGTSQGLIKINNEAARPVRTHRPGLGDHHLESEIPMPKPTSTTLAAGQLNASDRIEVELHRPADLPAFVLDKWPAAPSVASLDNFDNLVAAVYRVLADARTTLSRMRGERRKR